MSEILSHEKRFMNVLQNIPVAIHSCMISSRRTCCGEACSCSQMVINDEFSRLTGYSSADIERLYGNRICEMIVGEEREAYLRIVDELYEYPHEKTIVCWMMTKAGRPIMTEHILRSIRQMDGSVGLYAYVREHHAPVIQQAQPASDKRVVIRTFGYFNVLIDGQPIAFQHEKAKELLALLVDRQGKFVSSSEIISCLWEDEPVSDNTRSRCRKAAFYLREILEKRGLEDLIESTSKGYRRIRTEMVDCDLYRYLDGETVFVRAFRGAYMADYSWAEQTLTSLMYGK